MSLLMPAHVTPTAQKQPAAHMTMFQVEPDKHYLLFFDAMAVNQQLLAETLQSWPLITAIPMRLPREGDAADAIRTEEVAK